MGTNRSTIELHPQISHSVRKIIGDPPVELLRQWDDAAGFQSPAPAMRRLVVGGDEMVGATAQTQNVNMEACYGSINSHKLSQVIWPHIS
jgi:hypothetical protein